MSVPENAAYKYKLPDNFIGQLTHEQCIQVLTWVRRQDNLEMKLQIFKRKLETANSFIEWWHLYYEIGYDADKAKIDNGLAYSKIFETASCPDDWYRIYFFSAKNDEDKELALAKLKEMVNQGHDASFYTLTRLAELLDEDDPMIETVFQKAGEQAETLDQWKFIKDKAPVTSAIRNKAFDKVIELEENNKEALKKWARARVAKIRGEHLGPVRRFLWGLYWMYLYYHDLIVFSITFKHYTQGLGQSAKKARNFDSWSHIYDFSKSRWQKRVALKRQRQFAGSPRNIGESYNGSMGDLPDKYRWHRWILLRRLRKMQAPFADWLEGFPFPADYDRKSLQRIFDALVKKLIETADDFEEIHTTCKYLECQDKRYAGLLQKMTDKAENIGHWYALYTKAVGHPDYQQLAVEKIKLIQSNQKPE